MPAEEKTKKARDIRELGVGSMIGLRIYQKVLLLNQNNININFYWYSCLSSLKIVLRRG